MKQEYLAAVAEQEAKERANALYLAVLAEQEAKDGSQFLLCVDTDLGQKEQDIKNLQYLIDYLPTRQIFAKGTLSRAIIALGGKLHD